MNPGRPDYLDVLDAEPKRFRWKPLLAFAVVLGLLGLGGYWILKKVQPIVGMFGIAKETLAKAEKFEKALADEPELIHRQRWYVIAGEEGVVAPDMALDPKSAPTLWATAFVDDVFISAPLPESIPLSPPRTIGKNPAPTYEDALASSEEKTTLARRIPLAEGESLDGLLTVKARIRPGQRAVVLDARKSSHSEKALLEAAIAFANEIASATDRPVEIRVVGKDFDHVVLGGNKLTLSVLHDAHCRSLETWLGGTAKPDLSR